MNEISNRKQLHPNRKTLNAFVRFDNKESAKSAATDVYETLWKIDILFLSTLIAF